MKRADVIREVQSMLAELKIRGRYQVAKKIVALSEREPGARVKFWALWPGPGGVRPARFMVQDEAARIVADARVRIEAADEGEGG